MKKALPGIAILAMLTLPVALWLFGNRAATLENRAIAEWPTLSQSGVRSADYFREAEGAVVDRLPLRSVAVRYNSEMLLRLLGDSTSPKVVVGEGGFLFYMHSVKQRCVEPSVTGFVESAERAVRLMESLGKEMYILIAPDKAAVYDALLTTESCTANSAAAISRATGDITYILFPYDELRHLAAGSPPGDSPYYQWDTHWTTFGAATGSRAIIEAIAPSMWEDAAVVASSAVGNQGDLATLLGITREEVEPLYESVRLGATIRESSLPNLAGTDGEPLPEADGHRYEVEIVDGDVVNQNALFLHDSFGGHQISTLSSYFARLDTYRYPKIDNASGPSIREAEILILEFVQRSWSELTDEATDEALAAILADDLHPIPFVIESDGTITTISTVERPRCELIYLVIERPEDGTAPTVLVNGETLESRDQSRTAAFWSASGHWTVEALDAAHVAPIRVVDACPTT